MKKLDNQIEVLLLKKAFEELNKEERNLVLKEMTAKEYTQFRTTLLASQSLFEENQSTPNPAIKRNVQAAFRQQQMAKQSGLAKLVGLRIPAWQVAAALIGLWCFVQFNQNNEVPNTIADTTPEKIYIYQTDTVYKEVVKEVPTKFVSKKPKVPKKKIKPVIVPTIEKESQIVSAPVTPTPPTNMSSTISKTMDTKTTALKTPTTLSITPIDVVNQSPTGRTVKDDEDLMDFLVKVN